MTSFKSLCLSKDNSATRNVRRDKYKCIFHGKIEVCMTVFFVEHSWFEAEVYTRTKSGPPCTCHSHKVRYSWLAKVRARIQELYNFSKH